MIRKLAVEFLGTAILVYVACGVATLMFGFKFAGASVAAGVVATALAFGLTLLALVYFIGPVSGSHVNPAVTAGALLTGRIRLAEAAGYWVGFVTLTVSRLTWPCRSVGWGLDRYHPPLP
jgi:aquaporin Z